MKISILIVLFATSIFHYDVLAQPVQWQREEAGMGGDVYDIGEDGRGRLFACTHYDSLYYSDDKGKTWQSIGMGKRTSIWQSKYLFADSSYAWLRTDNMLYRFNTKTLSQESKEISVDFKTLLSSPYGKDKFITVYGGYWGGNNSMIQVYLYDTSLSLVHHSLAVNPFYSNNISEGLFTVSRSGAIDKRGNIYLELKQSFAPPGTVPTFIMSSDTGRSWRKLEPPPAYRDRYYYVSWWGTTDNAKPLIILGTPGSSELYTISDTTWQFIGQAPYVALLSASASLGDSLFVIGLGNDPDFRREDAGLYLTRNGGRSFERIEPPVPFRPTALYIGRDSTLYVAYKGPRFLRSRDFGRTWEYIGKGIHTYSVNAVCFDAHGRTYAMRDGDVWRKSGISGTWSKFYEHHHNFYSLWVEPDTTFIVQCVNGGNYFESSVLLVDTETGKYGRSIPDTVIPGMVQKFLSSRSGAWLFGGYRSTDRGATWHPGGSPSAQIRSGTMFALGQAMIYRSTDDGRTWSKVRFYKQYGVPYPSIFATEVGFTTLVEHPVTGRLFAGSQSELYVDTADRTSNDHYWYSSSFFYSDDGGQMWYPVSGYDDWAGGLTIDSTGAIWVGAGYHGIRRSTDNGATWAVVSDTTLEKFNILSLATSPEGYVYACTEGGGLFRTVRPFPPVGVAEQPAMSDDASLQIIPNPASESFRVVYSGEGTITVRDVLGRVVLLGAAGDTFSTAGLAAGAYSVEIYPENKSKRLSAIMMLQR